MNLGSLVFLSQVEWAQYTGRLREISLEAQETLDEIVDPGVTRSWTRAGCRL